MFQRWIKIVEGRDPKLTYQRRENYYAANVKLSDPCFVINFFLFYFVTNYNFVQNACLSELKMIKKGKNKFIIKPWKSYYDCNKLVAFNRKR